MRRSHSFSLVLAAALTGAIAAPAAAAPLDLDTESVRIDPYTWQFQSAPFGIASATYSSGGVTYGDAWDSSAFSIWSEDQNNESPLPPTSFACEEADVVVDELSGDVTVNCPTVVSTIGLSLDGELRLYGEGDLVRTLYLVSNPTASAVSFSYSYTVDFSGEPGRRATTSTPILGSDVQVAAGDQWVYNAEPSTLNALVAWGLAGAGAPVERVREWETGAVAAINDRDTDGEQIEVAPGGVLAFAFFHRLDPSGTAASRAELADVDAPVDGDTELEPATATSTDAIAAASAEFSTFAGRLRAGISDELVIANWEPLPVVDDDPVLAATGGDSMVVTVALVVGGILLATGVLLVVLRRVRRAAVDDGRHGGGVARR